MDALQAEAQEARLKLDGIRQQLQTAAERLVGGSSPMTTEQVAHFEILKESNIALAMRLTKILENTLVGHVPLQ